jgi:hypothetical protein
MGGSLRLNVSLVAVACAGLLALLGGGTAGAASSQPTANGNGTIFGSFQSFSFGSRGSLFSAEGRIHVVESSSDPDTQYKGRINCAFYTLNRVTLSGNITDVSPQMLPANTPTNFIAFAEDNGEPGEFIDRWNFIAFIPSPTFAPTCVNPVFGFGGSPLTSGNIDIDPVVP